MQTAQVAPRPLIVHTPRVDLHPVRYALHLIRQIHIRAMAQQELHTCGVSRGSCYAERTIPNLEKKKRIVRELCRVGEIQHCFNW